MAMISGILAVVVAMVSAITKKKKWKKIFSCKRDYHLVNPKEKSLK